jgi:tetratricopeptide (TPR) repeat protein
MKKQLIMSMFVLISFSLMGCQSYDVEVDLTEAQRTEAEEGLALWKSRLENFQPIEEQDDKVTDPAGLLKPFADVFINKAEFEMQLGRNDDAIRTYKEMLKNYDNSSVAWTNLGKMYHGAGNCRVATKWYKEGIEKLNMRPLYYDIVSCYKSAGDKSKAEQYYREWQQADPSVFDAEFEAYFSAE